MDSTTKESISAEIYSLNRMIQNMPSHDIIGKMSISGRIKELNKLIEKENCALQTKAEVIISFGGAPVNGSKSINLQFATDALKNYQNLLSSLYADIEGDVLASGPIPLIQDSQLEIEGIQHGSFGFVLKENRNTESLVNTKLKNAVEKSTEIIENIRSDGPLNISLNNRVFSYLKDFFKTLSNNSASVSIKSSNRSISMQTDEVAAFNNTIKDIISISMDDISVSGKFMGAMILKRRFDFIPEDKSTFSDSISGKISLDLSDDFLIGVNQKFTNKNCIAYLSRKTVSKYNSSKANISWTLNNIQDVVAS